MKKIIRFRPLSSEKARQQRQLFFLTQKLLFKVVLRCRLSMGVKFLLGLDAELMRFIFWLAAMVYIDTARINNAIFSYLLWTFFCFNGQKYY